MPRKRMIDPAIWDDDKFNSLCVHARLLFIGLFNLADDEGRLEDSVRYLRKKIFGYDLDITEYHVDEWIKEIETQKMILRYAVESVNYICVRNFKHYQSISHPTPSKIPPPNNYVNTDIKFPEDSGNTTGILHDNSDNHHGELHEDSEKTPSSIVSLVKYSLGEYKVPENIRMTQENINALVDRFGDKVAIQKIDKLSLYKYSKGKSYKSDYHTILNWDRMDSDKEEKGKPLHKPVSAKDVIKRTQER